MFDALVGRMPVDHTVSELPIKYVMLFEVTDLSEHKLLTRQRHINFEGGEQLLGYLYKQ